MPNRAGLDIFLQDGTRVARQSVSPVPPFRSHSKKKKKKTSPEAGPPPLLTCDFRKHFSEATFPCPSSFTETPPPLEFAPFIDHSTGLAVLSVMSFQRIVLVRLLKILLYCLFVYRATSN